MPVIEKQFAGGMDMDSATEVVSPHMHREAWNVRFNGPKGNEIPESIEGNTLVADQDPITDGTEVNIGKYVDKVNSRAFLFNFHPLGNHSITIYNRLPGFWQILIKNGVNNAGNVLNFSLSNPIEDIDIIYGDPEEGDLLFFLDSAGKPQKINIQRYLASTYSNILPVYLNVIKAPPVYPPQVVYENDNNVKNNNLLNSLFKYATSYVFDDNDESVKSTGSVVPLPVHAFTDTNSQPQTQDARIGIYFQTGGANVKKIKLYMKQTQNGSTSDWLLVDTIDKASSGIPDNTIYKYLFYNDGNYTAIDPAYGLLDFDRLPDIAGAMAVINGNILSFADITEGYDWFKSAFSYTINSGSARHGLNGFLYFADFDGTSVSGQPVIKLIISGAGQNDVNNNPVSVAYPAGRMWLYALSDSTDISFLVNNSNPSASIATLLASLQSAAVSAGWTVTTQTDVNSIRIYYPTGNIILKGTYYNDVGAGTPIDNFIQSVPRFALYEQCNYSFGIKYYDENGKDNGVITDITANVSTLTSGSSPGALGAVTSVILNLNAIIPPSWAKTYSVVRTDNKTYSKYLNWITTRTFNGVGQTVLTQYAYLDITNIDLFNEQEKASQPNITYGFEQGDHVRINALYTTQGTISNYFSFDYAILDLAINPVINGQQEQGRFLKIAYPATDIASQGPTVYNFADGFKFANYNITIYHISPNSSSTQNTGSDAQSLNEYFEFGYKFGIGNPGLVTAYHFGNVSDNQVVIQDGDIFYRRRTIPVGPTYYLYVPAVAFSGPQIIPTLYYQSVNTTITAPNWIVSFQNFTTAIPPVFSSSGGLFTNFNPLASINIRIRGEFQVSSSFVTWISLTLKLVNAANNVIDKNIIVHSQGVGDSINVQQIDIKFDQIVQVPPGYKVWLIYGNGEINPGTTNTHFNGFMLRIDVIQDIVITCWDKSYSDTYTLITNADNRPAIEQPEQRRLEYGTMYRWGGADQLNTNLNQSNRFYPLDFDETIKSYGNIVKLLYQGKLLHVFHYRKFGTVGVFQKWIKNNSGATELVVNDTIIEKNNIRYEVYDGGVGNQKSSITFANFAIYCVDPVKGYGLRWAPDGVLPISLMYKAQTWLSTSVNYLENYIYQFGGRARIISAFRVVEDNNSIMIMMFQGGQKAGGAIIDGRTIIFDETDNLYPGFWNLNADNILVIDNVLFSIQQAKLWEHDRNNFASFFGIQYSTRIRMIFNERGVIQKTFDAIGYQSNQIMSSPNLGDVATSTINPETGLQQTSLMVDGDYVIEENIRTAAIPKDASIGDPYTTRYEGDILKGNWLEIELSYGGGEFVFLYAPYILYSLSPRNF